MKKQVAQIFVSVKAYTITEEQKQSLESLIDLDDVGSVSFDIEEGSCNQGFEVAYTGPVNKGFKLLLDRCDFLGLEVDTIAVF